VFDPFPVSTENMAMLLATCQKNSAICSLFTQCSWVMIMILTMMVLSFISNIGNGSGNNNKNIFCGSEDHENHRNSSYIYGTYFITEYISARPAIKHSVKYVHLCVSITEEHDNC